MRVSPLAIRLLALLLAFAAPGFAATYTRGPGLDLPIPDDAYDGSLDSMACDLVLVTASGPVGAVRLGLQMGHTFVGDLTIKLRSPQPTLVTVMSRPELTESGDDGLSVGGSDANLSFAHPVEFKTGANHSAETMGNGLATSDNVCQADGICTFAPAHGAAAAGSFSDFLGQSAYGGWTLCIGDSAAEDVGELDSWTLNVDVIIFSNGFLTGDPCQWSNNAGGIACP